MANKKSIKKGIGSFITLLFVFSLVFSNGAVAVKKSFSYHSNINYILDLLYPCESFKTDPKENKVILRIDDIQAFYWRDLSIRMIEDAFKKEMPLVLGVIPVGLGKDRAIVNYLKRNSCNLEIAQHGLTHKIFSESDVPEFKNLTESEAYERIIGGKGILEKITDESIVSFIPPNNIYSSGTESALKKAGFKIISAEGDGYFDYTTFTYDFKSDKYTPVSEIMNECQKAFKKNNLCVIMIHPQDYATDGELDKEKYKNYLELLDEVEKMDIEVVKMKDLINEVQDNYTYN
jgi:hypothetical protein